MNRIIGLDLGLKRTGIAITDELRIITNPVGTFPTENIFTEIRNLLGKYAISDIVVGMPTKLNGEDTHATPLVKAFIDQFRTQFPEIVLHTVDERLTSREAKNTLVQAGIKKSQRKNKSLLDTVSASLILQTYLNSQ